MATFLTSELFMSILAALVSAVVAYIGGHKRVLWAPKQPDPVDGFLGRHPAVKLILDRLGRHVEQPTFDRIDELFGKWVGEGMSLEKAAAAVEQAMERRRAEQQNHK